MILPCKCKNDYQDQKYDKGNRVHNVGTKNKDRPVRTCTVCGDKKE